MQPASTIPSALLCLQTILFVGIRVAVMMVVWHAACADVTDRDQPLRFSADSIRLDEKNKRNIMQGNVEISKGSIVVRADRVEVIQDSDGSQKASATSGKGGKALFRQRREGRDEMIEGEADTVSYDSLLDVVSFFGRAVMRRMVGTILVDEVSGQTIVYDNKTDTFQVAGSPTSATTKERVRGVITPRKSGAAASGPKGQSDSLLLKPSAAMNFDAQCKLC